MSKIPTIDEVIKNIRIDQSNLEYIAKTGVINGSLYTSIHKEFKPLIEMYVKAALEAAAEKACLKVREDYLELHQNDNWMEIDKQSILNAYPLDNIK